MVKEMPYLTKIPNYYAIITSSNPKERYKMHQQQELILKDLQTRYKKATISKREMANELGVGYSTLDNYIAKGYGIPSYRKLGKSKNGKILFSLIDVSEFLSQTIKTA